jgi:hypothetical protein
MTNRTCFFEPPRRPSSPYIAALEALEAREAGRWRCARGQAYILCRRVGLDAVRDLAIAAGKIAAVEANITGDATETIDARGKIVAPGLIDIHTHAGPRPRPSN